MNFKNTNDNACNLVCKYVKLNDFSEMPKFSIQVYWRKSSLNDCNEYIYIYIYIRLKIKPNSVRIRFLSCQIFVLPSTGFELTPLIHCSTNRLALCLAPQTTRPHPIYRYIYLRTQSKAFFFRLQNICLNQI